MMLHAEKTCTTHSFSFKNFISNAWTVEMIYENAFPWLCKTQKVYNKHTAYIQLFSAVVRQCTSLSTMDYPNISKHPLPILHLNL